MFFKFVVSGRPVPKARPRLGRGGRVFTPQKTQDYEALVAASARQAKPPYWLTDGDYGVAVRVYLNGNVFGDLDNMVKSICDGLNHAGIWEDDKHVCSLTAHRSFVDAEPHAEVVVTYRPREVFKKTKRSRKVAP